MSRKLATIRIINQILPIAGADLIELAVIDGWRAIVKKGEFIRGEFCIYCEIDSLLPIKEDFEFLRSRCYVSTSLRGEGFRIKTMKMRGHISQGLVLPLSVLKNAPDRQNIRLGLGADVTNALDIKLWEPKLTTQYPTRSSQVSPGLPFPYFLEKTDQERIQNIPEDLLNDPQTYERTLKMDGTSITVYKYRGVIGICSRNREIWNTCNTINAGADFLDISGFMKSSNMIEYLQKSDIDDVAFQGELCGNGIQCNKHKLSERQWHIFDVYDISQHAYMLPEQRRQLVRQIIPHLSYIYHIPVLDAEYTLPSENTRDAIIEESLKVVEKDGTPLEGIVYKSNSKQFSFKAINNNYLLKNNL